MNSNIVEEKRRKISKELDKLIEEKKKEVEKYKGWLSRVTQKIGGCIFKGPLTEIYEDWLTVRGFAMGVRDSIIRESLNGDSILSKKNNKISKEQKKDENKNDQREWEDKVRRFVTVAAYLKLAKCERDPGQAWRYVNSADKILPLLIEKDEMYRCVQRFRDWDKRLPKKLQDKLDERENEINKDYEKSDGSRDHEYSKQAIRVRFWNNVNSDTSLRYNLFRSFSYKLLAVLIIAIFFAEYSDFVFTSNKIWWFFPFLTISVMGFFGGGLSAILIARKSIVNRPNRVEIEVQITLRMLIGAAGAFVMYIMVRSGLIAEEISFYLNDNVAVFLILGIAAGFSEQLFVGPLERISSKLKITDETLGEKK